MEEMPSRLIQKSPPPRMNMKRSNDRCMLTLILCNDFIAKDAEKNNLHRAVRMCILVCYNILNLFKRILFFQRNPIEPTAQRMVITQGALKIEVSDNVDQPHYLSSEEETPQAPILVRTLPPPPTLILELQLSFPRPKFSLAPANYFSFFVITSEP